jgi:uncharacterized protein YpuA (DUF1002 family)
VVVVAAIVVLVSAAIVVVALGSSVVVAPATVVGTLATESSVEASSSPLKRAMRNIATRATGTMMPMRSSHLRLLSFFASRASSSSRC